MSRPEWLESQLARYRQDPEWQEYRRDERQQASIALADAVEKFNACRDLEGLLRKQGRDHLADAGWMYAARQFELAAVTAAGHGFDLQLISEEATRRRG